MCRFLLIKSTGEVRPKNLLEDFAVMCKNNAEWQGDGWGVAYKIRNSKFEVRKFLNPIWEETKRFDEIPPSNVIVVHARGASFPNQKGDIDFNQPYIEDDLVFIFNGELYGVGIKAEGKIGAQKIFFLLKKHLSAGNAAMSSLQYIRDLLIKNSKSILGCNIAFYNEDNFYAACYFGDENKKDYYTIRYYSDSSLSIICSEKIGNFSWKDMKKGEIIKL